LKKYETYKDSGIEWIGEMPEHWKKKKLTYSLNVLKGRLPKDLEDEQSKDSLPYLSMDVIRGSEPSSYTTDDGAIVAKKGDLAILWDGSKAGEFIIIPIQGVISSTVAMLTLIDNNLHKTYTQYLFKEYERDIQNNTIGMGIPHVDGNHLKNLKLLIPPLSEQHQIVTFLDYKTALIDQLLEQTRKKIALLKEKRTALINELVTGKKVWDGKQWTKPTKTKDSGIEWIREIPTHWVISKFKYDSSTPVQYGINISGNKYVDEGIRFIRITDISDSGDLNPNDGKYLIPEDVPNEFYLRKFDVLFCRSGHTVGKSYLHTLDGLFSSGGYLVRFNFRNYTESKFIFYLSKSHFYWDWIKLNTVVSTIENVNGDKYQNFVYPKPSLPEKQQIVEYLDEQTHLIDKNISAKSTRIELLKEYRQSLISEAVTGKVDLRDWQAPKEN
jgi:type I restriction enzyme S subunit